MSIRPPRLLPSTVAFHSMSSLGRHVVLFGGRPKGGGALDDTWLLRDGRWVELDLEPRPPARGEATLVQTKPGRALLVGGYEQGHETHWALKRRLAEHAAG